MRCEYIQSNMTFFFCHFHRNYSLSRQKVIKFAISGFDLVEMDTLLARFQNFIIGGHFDFFFKNAVHHIGESYPPILLIFKNKHRKTTSYLVLNLKVIGAKMRPWECRNEKVQNGCKDVIGFEISKTEKYVTRRYLPDHL